VCRLGLWQTPTAADAAACYNAHDNDDDDDDDDDLS